jgi:hypothetical protein
MVPDPLEGGLAATSAALGLGGPHGRELQPRAPNPRDRLDRRGLEAFAFLRIPRPPDPSR